jgi:hypothetical protein
MLLYTDKYQYKIQLQLKFRYGIPAYLKHWYK